jgi:putative DNA-invertase from lambdoid prophage Rac
MQGMFMKVALYARVSTHDQHTLPLQLNTMRAYVKKRRWTLTMQVCEIGSGAMARPKREELLKAAHRRAIDVIVVWRLDRWGRSLADLVVTLKALHELGVGFVSLTEAIDLTTPSGRAMAGMLAVFAEFERDIIRERVKAGLAQARAAGRILGRPPSAVKKAQDVKILFAQGLSRSEIARRVGIGRTSVRRILT